MLPLLILAATSSLAQQSNPAACRTIADDRERLACYDAALPQHAGPANTPVAPTATPSAAGTQPTPEDLFGRDAEASEAMVREAAGIEQVESITSAITGLASTAHGKFVVTLSNDQVWTQIDSEPVRLAAGDAVTIRRAALDSYLLVPANGGRSMRVRRSR